MAWFGGLSDFSKIGETLGSSIGASLGDAIQKAKDEVEKGVEKALSIDPYATDATKSERATGSPSSSDVVPTTSNAKPSSSPSPDAPEQQQEQHQESLQNQFLNIAPLQSLTSKVGEFQSQSQPSPRPTESSPSTPKAISSNKPPTPKAPFLSNTDATAPPVRAHTPTPFTTASTSQPSTPSSHPHLPTAHEPHTHHPPRGFTPDPEASTTAPHPTTNAPSEPLHDHAHPVNPSELAQLPDQHQITTSSPTPPRISSTPDPTPNLPTTPTSHPPSTHRSTPDTGDRTATPQPASDSDNQFDSNHHAKASDTGIAGSQPSNSDPPAPYASDSDTAVPRASDNGNAAPPPASDSGTDALHASETGTAVPHAAESSVAAGLGSADLEGMEVEELRGVAQQLQAALATREGQMERQAQQMSSLEQVLGQLQERNQQLVLRASKISEEDFEQMRAEFEQRLATAEKKASAAGRERDEWRKERSRLEAVVKEKEGVIAEVLQEGDMLSRKRVEMEMAVKRIRGQLKDAEGERDRLSAKVSTLQEEMDGAKRALARTERELQATKEQATADLAAQREQWEALLNKARAAQVEAEERGREAGKEGTVRRVREAESRAEALGETVAELKDALERQRQAANLREEMMQQDLQDLERRCQAAESRHSELMAKLPEATRPLLRQIEAMQAAASAQSEAWAAAEGTLQQRIADAEARAAAASERELLANDRQQILLNKVQAVEAALTASRAEVKRLGGEVELAGRRAVEAEEEGAAAARQVELLKERVAGLQAEVLQVERVARDELEVERVARQAAEADAAAARREAEKKALEAKADADRRSGRDGGLADGAPSLAGPGMRWVLMREEDAGYRLSGGGESSGLGLRAASPSGQALLRSGSSSSTASMPMHGSHPGLPLATELESMRSAMRARAMEVGALEGHLREVEAQRDRLAEELVAAAQESEAAATAIRDSKHLRAQMVDLQRQLAAATELIGERDESLEELRADLADIKLMYKEQIEYMVLQLAAAHPPPTHHPEADGSGAGSGGPALPVSTGSAS